MHTPRFVRARVNERLTRAARFPVTLLAAPAGFGKSVALRDFIESSRLNAAVLELRREDSALLDFVRRLSQAIASAAPTAAAAFPALAERVMAASQPVREISDWFVEHTKRATCTIVIDDLHHATDVASVAFLADVIERTSDRISWIIAARTDMGLPVATWVAYGRMDFPVGEDDLRFTPEEALAAAGDDGDAAPHEVESLRALTGGWPVALNIALRTRTRVTDLAAAASGTREIVYRYLAEQILASLPEDQRSFLLRSSVFSSLDGELVDGLGAREIFEAVRRNVTFLTEVSPGEFRYHDLFREFLETELLRSGRSAWLQAAGEGARLLEARGDERAALLLYARASDAAAIVRILERSGLALFERGEGAALRTAIESLPQEKTRASAMVQALRAMLEAARGHFETAEPAFLAAIADSQDASVRLNLVHRYAVELVRQGRDCIALLEPVAQDKSVPKQAQLPILGTLATAYAGAGSFDRAEDTIERALKLVDTETSDETRARLLQQASYVYQFTHADRARKYAALAIELAVARNLYDVAARASSVQYAILYNETTDPIGLLGILDRLGEYARKSGSEQTRLYGLIASYDLQVERGEESALEELDRELTQSQAALPLASNEMLVPARALRETWSGNFRGAFALVRENPRAQRNDELRAVAASVTALCAFAAGMPGEGDAFVHEANEALQTITASNMQTIRARLFLALAEMQRGRDQEAHRHLAAAEKGATPSMTQLRAFAHAVRVAYRVRLSQSDDGSWPAALDRLRAVHFGGIARLLAALPTGVAASEGYSSLTPAEREILQLLALGASSKDVAAKTGRSPQTVDTHIRSICRKLGCSGRREAVALATSSGWVET
ncbi:MAG TPA: LuxR C-terminal-related transcriptional regulator [Candidatus Rubrimentiphilum sp.]|nr:LuxR C-terminal-related transcriptional regulator [Candidatus Rubrimentiphilum sp.]